MTYAEKLILKKKQETANAMQEVESEAQRLWDEEFGADIEAASYSLAKRLRQIRGEET